MNETVGKRDQYKVGRLSSRPSNTIQVQDAVTGRRRVELSQKKECILYVPRNYQPGIQIPFALMLHGAGGNAAHGLSYIQQYGDERNILLLAPASHDYSWDIIADNSFGIDVLFLDNALSYVFENFSVDASRLAIGGFSDGASYALSIGLSNGDLFTHIIAFSPGFSYTYENHGKPNVYLSHGVDDDILPIDPCSRRIVPKLKREGLALLYEEFNGRHEIPPAISKTAVEWFIP